jgi:hypothetical protein
LLTSLAIDQEAIMSIPFGPQLIGQTEKTLVALLRRSLEGTGLSEPQWVTLRVADQLDGTVDTDELTAAVADRAQLPDAAHLVSELTSRGLLADGQLTTAGRDTITSVLARSEQSTGHIWLGLPVDDVAATTSVLNEVLERARAVLADERSSARKEGA